MAHSLWAEISQIKSSQKTKSGLYVKDNKSIGSNAKQQWTIGDVATFKPWL